MHNISVDYTQALDSVYRNKIIECSVQYKVPTKLIRLMDLTLTNARATVKVNNKYTEEFKAESGVNQGDSLSATLFNIVADATLKQFGLIENISKSLKQCFAYTDNILISTRTTVTN